MDKLTRGSGRLQGQSWEERSVDINKCRAASLASLALGIDCFAKDSYEDVMKNAQVKTWAVRSSKACALLAFDQHCSIATLSFRGTRDPIDLLTDLSVMSTKFEPR